MHSQTQSNRKGDEIAQVASDYSPAELAYFKVLVGPHQCLLLTSHLCVMVILGRNDRHGTKFILLSLVDGGPSRKSISQVDFYEDACGARVGYIRRSGMVAQEQVRTSTDRGYSSDYGAQV